jgi:endonuclease/exonuclease/phosphatase family metal-dependent hydrolase
MSKKSKKKDAFKKVSYEVSEREAQKFWIGITSHMMQPSKKVVLDIELPEQELLVQLTLGDFNSAGAEQVRKRQRAIKEQRDAQAEKLNKKNNK